MNFDPSFPSLHTIIEFIVIWVIWRGVIVRRLSNVVEKHILIPFVRWLKIKLIHSRQDATLYLHYFNKSMNKGHQCKFKECDDDWCRMI
jgi:hypothetical protein